MKAEQPSNKGVNVQGVCAILQMTVTRYT